MMINKEKINYGVHAIKRAVIKRIYHVIKLLENMKHETDIKRKRQKLRAAILSRDFSQQYPGCYTKEINWLKRHDSWYVFPYDFPDKYRNSYEVFNEDEMCYVLHRGKEQKLFFPWKDKKATESYYRWLLTEQDAESPHCYFTNDFQVSEGDIFVDVGSAEGMISLDIVDMASKVYLIECLDTWIPALKKTFSGYQNVEIINKKASDVSDQWSVCLDDLISDTDKTIVIKIDVEGSEIEVLNGAKRLLKNNKIKCVCCTYHKPDDEKELEGFFNERAYKCRYSNGYFLLVSDVVPYFRRGVLRAYNV